MREILSSEKTRKKYYQIFDILSKLGHFACELSGVPGNRWSAGPNSQQKAWTKVVETSDPISYQNVQLKTLDVLVSCICIKTLLFPRTSNTANRFYSSKKTRYFKTNLQYNNCCFFYTGNLYQKCFGCITRIDQKTIQNEYRWVNFWK